MKTRRFSILGFLCTLLTLVMAVAWIFPIYWITITSLKSEDQTIVVPPSFIPWPPNFDAFVYVLQNSPFIRWYINTIVVSVTVTFFCILFALMCAYALSQLQFEGRRLIYTALLVGFMLPFSALAVPLFMMMNRFNLVNTFAGLILPQIAVPLPVIVFKQFFDDVPRDFRDAALIDGASNWRILFRIYLPLNWNITWAMSIVTFISTWNNFFWPLIITNSTPMLTIPVGMTQIQLAYGVSFAKICATAVLASIPTAAAYLLFQKRVTQGVMAVAGLK
ncbi:MAG TPA: carbohydrate ABC transporter permease [Chthoniobacterales bacterium]|nr:carbohydrate ABC transporter permease [Chthoniobacterales bacterium]